jgi:hypothetical protein
MMNVILFFNEDSSMNLFYMIIILALLSGCVPQQKVSQQQAQVSSQSPNTSGEQEAGVQETLTPMQIPTELLGTILTVPDTNSQLTLDKTIVAGTLTDLQSQPKGTIQLSATQSLRITDTPYLVLPGTISLVTGGGGVYLFLLEQQGETFIQKQAVNLGNRIELLTLEQEGSTITSITVDPRTGKPPFTDTSINPSKPGKKVFEVREGQLVEVN